MTTISVAIESNPGIKHWSLFIETPNANSNNGGRTTTQLQLLGARQNYFLSIQSRSDVRKSDSLEEMVELCRVEGEEGEGEASTNTIKNLAGKIPIRNNLADYSCQDFVLELLDVLEEDGVLGQGAGESYGMKKEYLRQKREVWQ